MGQITSGTIFLEERIPGPADYQHRAASATIHFDVGDGGDPLAMADAAGELARRKVNELLGRGVAQPVQAPAAHKASGKADKGQGAGTAKVQAAATPTPAPTAPTTAEPFFASPPADAKALPIEQVKPAPVEQVKKTADVFDFGTGEVIKAKPVAELVAASEGTSFDFGTGAPVPADIGDKELVDLISVHVGKTGNGAAVNRLILKYAGKPGAYNIAKAVRPSFLEQLHLIKEGDI